MTVRERFISGRPGEIVYGQQYGKVLEVNPVPVIVELLIHDSLRELHPGWSRRTLRAQTTRLFHRLTEDEMRTIYEIYMLRRL